MATNNHEDDITIKSEKQETIEELNKNTNEQQTQNMTVADKLRMSAMDGERRRQAKKVERELRLAEEERQRKATEKAEIERKAAEAERQRKATEEVERLRKAAEEAERQRIAAEEMERKRKAAEEAERLRKAVEEAERERRLTEEERQRLMAKEELRYSDEINGLISGYFTKEKEAIAALKTERNTKLLDSLGLYSMKKEYAPEGYEPPISDYIAAYPKYETVNGRKFYYREIKVYPEINDETYIELAKMLREKEELVPKQPVIEKKEEKKPLKLSITPDHSGNTGIASSFMKAIAWILWIGGLILAIVSSRTEVVKGTYYQYTETIFVWLTFFTISIQYALLGGFAWCMSELFENISTIKNELLGFKAEEGK